MLESLRTHFQLNIHKSHSTEKVILLFPGLNLKFEAMQEMAIEISKNAKASSAIFKHNAARSLLSELKILRQVVTTLVNENPNIKIYCVGHSYGALLSLQLAHHISQIQANVLIAPALKLKNTSEIFQKIIKRLPINFSITSMNFSGYGQYNSLSTLRYKELFQLKNESLNFQENKNLLVILSKKDRVISEKKSREFFENLNHPVLTIPFSKASTFHHLPLDRKNLGETGFQLVTGKISDFLAQL